jgi:hypothetical protein
MFKGIWDMVLGIALGLFLMFLLLRGCSEPKPGDTIYIRGKDSLRIDYVKIEKNIPVPYPVAVYPAPLPAAPNQPDPCDSLRVYRSVLDTAGASLVITDSVQGVLISQVITGRLPVTYINRVDTIRQSVPGRAYRYGLGVLTDGKQFQCVARYGVRRNLDILGSYESEVGIRMGIGFRF